MKLLFELLYFLFVGFMKAVCIMCYIIPLGLFIYFGFEVWTLAIGFISILMGVFLSLSFSIKLN